jgi:SNF2 family DNA or RNA helicase
VISSSSSCSVASNLLSSSVSALKPERKEQKTETPSGGCGGGRSSWDECIGADADQEDSNDYAYDCEDDEDEDDEEKEDDSDDEVDDTNETDAPTEEGDLNEAQAEAILGSNEPWRGRSWRQLERTSSKLRQLMDLMARVIAVGEQMIVFSFSKRFLHLTRRVMARRGWNHLTPPAPFDGNTLQKDRQPMVDRFNEGNWLVLLVSSKAGGVGLTMIGRQDAIPGDRRNRRERRIHVAILDFWWNPFPELQCRNRAQRRGQTVRVRFYRFICKDEQSVELFMIGLQGEKLAEAQKLIGDLARYTSCIVIGGVRLMDEFKKFIAI